jgi:hypothetical protein
VNRPIRRVAVVVLLLLLALLVNVNWVQGFQAASLAQRPDNQRVRVAEYSRERGSILVGGEAVARSTPTDDALKYLRRYPGGAEYAPVTGYYSILYGSNGRRTPALPVRTAACSSAASSTSSRASSPAARASSSPCGPPSRTRRGRDWPA